MRSIVLPAVEAVLREGEVETLSISSTAPLEFLADEDGPGRFWLNVVAVGEPFYLCLDSEPLRNVGIDGMRQNVTESLKTFVAESRFGWGQNR
jgi:hypothetical protein